MKRQHETRMLLFLMTGTAFLFFAAAVPLSGFGFFLLAQAAGLVLGGITLVSLFRRYRGLRNCSRAASIYVLYVRDDRALFSPEGGGMSDGATNHELAESRPPTVRIQIPLFPPFIKGDEGGFSRPPLSFFTDTRTLPPDACFSIFRSSPVERSVQNRVLSERLEGMRKPVQCRHFSIDVGTLQIIFSCPSLLARSFL